MNWKTTLNYSKNGIDYEQTFTGPFLPQKGDLIVTIFKDENGQNTDGLCYHVEYISFSNLTFTTRINLK